MVKKGEVEELISKALAARERAYAPYSGFAVGAALLTSSGKIYEGCNIENVSHSLAICAERVALFRAVAAGERQFSRIAIVSEGGAMPCGACRQVLAEFSGGLEVIVADTEGAWRLFTLEELLPKRFGAKIGLGEGCGGDERGREGKGAYKEYLALDDEPEEGKGRAPASGPGETCRGGERS